MVTEFSAGISAKAEPFSITAGPDGNLWFTEWGANRIGRITPSGVVTEFSAGISATRSMGHYGRPRWQPMVYGRWRQPDRADYHRWRWCNDADLSIALLSGWNLVSLPAQPANTTIATVLSGITGAYEVVWGYPGQSWKVYDPNDPDGSTLTTMEAGKGYWIKMTSAETLSVSGAAPSSSPSFPRDGTL